MDRWEAGEADTVADRGRPPVEQLEFLPAYFCGITRSCLWLKSSMPLEDEAAELELLSLEAVDRATQVVLVEFEGSFCRHRLDLRLPSAQPLQPDLEGTDVIAPTVLHVQDRTGFIMAQDVFPETDPPYVTDVLDASADTFEPLRGTFPQVTHCRERRAPGFSQSRHRSKNRR